jgi:hypothetical protein
VPRRIARRNTTLHLERARSALRDLESLVGGSIRDANAITDDHLEVLVLDQVEVCDSAHR